MRSSTVIISAGWNFVMSAALHDGKAEHERVGPEQHVGRCGERTVAVPGIALARVSFGQREHLLQAYAARRLDAGLGVHLEARCQRAGAEHIDRVMADVARRARRDFNVVVHVVLILRGPSASLCAPESAQAERLGPAATSSAYASIPAGYATKPIRFATRF